jgi:hypothetical protein
MHFRWNGNWISEEIAQTTHYCCLCCTNHSLFTSFAENTNFTCSWLHGGPNQGLDLLTANLTARAHSE